MYQANKTAPKGTVSYKKENMGLIYLFSKLGSKVIREIISTLTDPRVVLRSLFFFNEHTKKIGICW